MPIPLQCFLCTSIDQVKSAPEAAFFSGLDQGAEVGICVKTLVTLCIAINVVCLFKSQGCRVRSVHALDDDNRSLGLDWSKGESAMAYGNKSVGASHLVKGDITPGNFGQGWQAFAVKQ